MQQIYGGGIGWTAIKTPKQEADLRGTIQYESQKFISGAPTANQNLVGSTFAVNYVLHLKLLTYTQAVAYIPAYNQLHAYSGNESNTVAFPAYKSFSFSVGNDRQLSQRSTTGGPPHPAELLPVHNGRDLHGQVEVLISGAGGRSSSQQTGKRRLPAQSCLAVCLIVAKYTETAHRR